MTQRRRLDAVPRRTRRPRRAPTFRDGVRVERRVRARSRASTGRAIGVDVVIGADGAQRHGGAARSGSAARSSTASRSRATARTTAAGAPGAAMLVLELARRSRRLRLDLPEGRPRQRRRRRLGERGPAAARTPARALRGARHRPDELTQLRGTACRCGGRRRCSRRGRALVVGDAAGLVDPFSGDGMYEAFVSRRRTTPRAAEASLARRPRRVRRRRAPRARPARRGGLGREGGARPLPADVVRAHAAPGDVAACSRSSCWARWPTRGRPRRGRRAIRRSKLDRATLAPQLA